MTTKITFLLGAFALGLAAVAGPATASILNWKLENVQFNDGGQMSGAFSVDTTDGAVTAFDITTTTGSVLAGFHYDGATGFAGGDLLSGNSFIIQDNAQDRYIQFDFANPLTSGGVNSLLPPLAAGSGSFECNSCVLSATFWLAAMRRQSQFPNLRSGRCFWSGSPGLALPAVRSVTDLFRFNRDSAFQLVRRKPMKSKIFLMG
jgi:hypothetical protein